MNSKEIFSLRKQGESLKALEIARKEYPNNQEDIWFIRAYGWCLHDRVKEIVVNYEKESISKQDLSNKLSNYMREFSQIGEKLKKDTCFSNILSLANRVSRDWKEFLDFSYWAGIDCFSDEDKKPFETKDGTKIDSLQSRYLRSIVREIANRKEIDGKTLEWGKSVFEKAIDCNPSDYWLNYYQSKISLKEGDTDSAIKSLLPVVYKKIRDYWVWQTLAEIIEKNNQMIH